MARRILIHALIISDINGNFLVYIIRNEELDEAMLSGFIAALNTFGAETLGKIEDISISGLAINLLVVSKHNLICIAVMDSDLPELNFREGCEKILDTFYEKYKLSLTNWNGHIKTFKDFKIFLDNEIQNYFVKLKDFRRRRRNKEMNIYDKSQELSPEQIIYALEKELSYYRAINSSLKEEINVLKDENKKLRLKIAQLNKKQFADDE
ncbi:MAG: hypothetical protein ACTSQJ_05260 [Promethearchaeota archaeon]